MLWRIYFFALLVLNAPTYLLQSYARQWEVFDALFFLLSCVGLFGQVWGKYLIGRRFWQVFVPVFVIWNVFYNYLIPPSPYNAAFFTAKLGWSPPTIAMIHMLTLLPALHALWVYAYESAGFWNPHIYTVSTYTEKPAPPRDASAPS